MKNILKIASALGVLALVIGLSVYPPHGASAAGTTFRGYQLKNSDGTDTLSACGTSGSLAVCWSTMNTAITTAVTGLAPAASAPKIIASNRVPGATGSIGGIINDSLHTLPTTGNYRIDARLTVNAVTAGAVTLTFTYTDDDGNSQSLPLATSVSGPGVYLISGDLIGMTASTSYSLNSTVVGAITYNVGAVLTYEPAV